MRRVLIGIPALTGDIDASCVVSLIETQRACFGKIDLQVQVVRGITMIQVARNMLWDFAVTQGYDDLVMIDADQDWQAEWFEKLLFYPVDCVGGLVRGKCEAERYTVSRPKEGLHVDPATGLMRVAGLGAGFLRVSRRALLALWEDAEPYTTGGKPGGRWIMDMHPIRGELVGEDVMISAKLWEHHRIPTYLDPKMVCGHWGKYRYTGDFMAWLQQQAMVQEAAE